MIRLEFPIEKKGFRYDLIERRGMWAIIEQVNLWYPKAPHRFEVWLIKTQKERTLRGVKYPECELMSATSKWGEVGWTFFELKKAYEWFNEKAPI